MALYDEWKFRNNIFSFLAADLTDVATTLTVAPGDGALFPTVYPYHLTIENFALEKREIVRVTDVTGDVLTVTRAQDNTSAVAFSTGDVVSMRLTAGQIDDIFAALKRLNVVLLPPSGVEPVVDQYGAAVQNGAIFYNTARAQWGFREGGAWIYVTDRPRLDISDTPPSAPTSPQLWFQPTALQMFIYYNDGDSSQWVPTSPVTTTLSVPQTTRFDVFEDAQAVVAKTATYRVQGRRTFSSVRASVATASAAGQVEVDVLRNGLTIFSTNLTIDQDEKTSKTAATPYALNSSSLIFEDDDEVQVSVISGGTALGLTVYLTTRVA